MNEKTANKFDFPTKAFDNTWRQTDVIEDDEIREPEENETVSLFDQGY